MDENIKEFLSNFFLYGNEKPKKNKLVIGSGLKGIHYTIHFGGESGFFDIHKTNERTKDHTTLFRIKREDAIEIIKKASEYIPTLLKTILPRKLDLSVINSDNFFIISIHNQNKLKEYVDIKENRFKFSKVINLKDLSCLYLLPNEINKSDGSLFMLYDRRYTFKGFLMKAYNNKNSFDLFFFHKDKCNILIKNYLNVFQDIILSLNIDGKENILLQMSNIAKDLKLFFF